MPEVKFHPEAIVDLREAVRWYDVHNPTAADRFTTAIERVIEEIGNHPRRWPLIDDRHRIRPIVGFPYAIFYRASQSRIVVVAVSHSRRDHAFWRSRSDEETADESERGDDVSEAEN